MEGGVWDKSAIFPRFQVVQAQARAKGVKAVVVGGGNIGAGACVSVIFIISSSTSVAMSVKTALLSLVYRHLLRMRW